MSAYQDLMTALATRRPDQSAAEDERIVEAALAKHAHELAEQIRAWADDPMAYDSRADAYGDVSNVLNAANLIDPQQSAGPVRPDEETTT